MNTVYMEIPGLGPDNVHVPVIGYIHDRYGRVFADQEHPVKTGTPGAVHDKIEVSVIRVFRSFHVLQRIKAAVVQLRQKQAVNL
jgi:hypothetical protein